VRSLRFAVPVSAIDPELAAKKLETVLPWLKK